MKFRIFFKSRISGYYKVAWNKKEVEGEANSLDEAVEKATKGYEVKFGSVRYERVTS